MWVVPRTGKSQLSGDLRPWGALSFVTWPLLTELSKGDGPVMCSSVFLVSVVLHTGESYFLQYALLTLHRAPLLLLTDPLTAWDSARTLVSIGILCFSHKADFISWPPFHLAIYVSYFSMGFQSSKGQNCFVSLWTHCNTLHVLPGLVSGWLEVSQNHTHAAVRLSSFLANQCSSSSASSDWRWWRSSRSTIVRNGKKYTVI